jgi:hypothetical protein
VRELSLHLLDIAENSISAGSKNITINIFENSITDLLQIEVFDDGRGMPAEMVKQVIDPFVTSRTTRKVGLGIPLLKEAAEACKGSLQLQSNLGKGTSLEVVFQRSHIDRMPLGDVPTTFLNLLVSNPNIHWVFRYQVNENEFFFDDIEVKEALGDISLTEPEVLKVIREIFETGIANLKCEKY